jgi:hypothetical protein
MERSELFDLMGELQLYGMKAAFDEIMTTAVKRQHEPQRIIGDLLTAEINEKETRSIKYQLTALKEFRCSEEQREAVRRCTAWPQRRWNPVPEKGCANGCLPGRSQ